MNINVHIFHVGLRHPFLVVQVVRICSNIKTFYLLVIFSMILITMCLKMQLYCEENLDAGPYWGLKGKGIK